MNLFLGPNGEVFYNSSEAIGGFQFNMDRATVSAATGGDTGAAGFAVSPGGSTVLGFSFTGATFGPGCGVLTNLALNGDATSLSGLILSSATGAGLPFVYYVPDAGGNLVADWRSDEYPDCAANAFDCAGECGGSAVEDECGVCGGDGIADGGACDCDGNVDLGCGCGEDAAEENFDCDGNCEVDIDCAGVCGGGAVEDECGVCGGDGSSCLINIAFSLENAVNGGVDVYMSNTHPIIGFQFDIDGIVLTEGEGFGGVAESSGFIVSTGPNGVMGFSLAGQTIPVGSGLLTQLSGYTFDDFEVCISDVVLSVDGKDSDCGYRFMYTHRCNC